MKIYYESDVDKKVLEGMKIAVVGYGSQGHAHALNLKDSGLDVMVAQRPGGSNHDLAVSHGFEPVSAAEAAKQADLIAVLVPDPAQPRLYHEEIAPNIREGAAVLFSHGFNVHYGQIVPAENLDVVMIAPKGPGHLVRREYETGAGVPSLVAVEQDASGKALEKALGYAWGLGAARAGVIETTFKEETETDLFGEQSVLCGGITELMLAGWETLVDAGYQPEVAYFECLHEMKLIVDLIYEGGMNHMRYSISDTAEYGDLTRGKRVIGTEVRAVMRKILEDIQSGEFAKEWILENQAGLPMFKALRRRAHEHPIQEVGAKLRSMMGWLKK